MPGKSKAGQKQINMRVLMQLHTFGGGGGGGVNDTFVEKQTVSSTAKVWN